MQGDELTKLTEIFAAVPGYIKDYVLEPLTHIGVIDFIDIFLLTMLLFYIYRFIRNRRAGKLALGLILMLVVLVMTSLLEMRAIGFILQNFYQVGIIAVLIIFQPELRAALEKVGNTSIVTGIKNFTTGDRKQALSQIVATANAISDAAKEMSEQKVGALIVIERTTKLGEYIGTGITLNADLSSDLLKNIFFKNAPLHDGGMVISGDRVVAAKCVLPSTQQEVPKSYGMRHRAALGMSEVSDAIIIAVSEETGGISLAHDSVIKRNIDPKQLQQSIRVDRQLSYQQRQPKRQGHDGHYEKENERPSHRRVFLFR